MRTLTRAEAIEDLRRRLIQLCGEQESLCALATRRGVFCRGFRRFTDEQLFARLDWLVRRQHPKTREELEALADRWQMARLEATEARLPCDVQTEERDVCCGWDDFDNAELERQYLELRNELVRVL